ncbi:MAG: peptide deformylase [Myxococcales bacterium]|nr:peptide deformylase [Myxococcales bacterium]
MALRDVVVWPDPRLRQPSVPVTDFGPALRSLYQDLVDTMYAERGLGIAALQLGDPTRMFIVEPELAGRAKDDPPVAFINPEVTYESPEQQKSDEGCLSFPHIYVQVERPMRTTVRAQDLDGNWFEASGEGLLARCLLHENDHLTGKLLVDFVGPLKRQMIKRKLAKRDDHDADV